MVKPRTLRIGARDVGDGQPCFVLAEGGLNHNGDACLAEDLVRIAASAKADAVKFQKRTVEALLTREAFDAPYGGPNSFGPTYGEHRLALELTAEVWQSLRDLATSLGLEFLGSGWDEESMDFLEALDPPAYKIGSPDLTNLDLVHHTARKGKPVILSTGMSTLVEVDEAVNAALAETDQLILLQCTSSYPSEFDEINLRVMETYRERYGLLVGYSGHERGIAVSEAAATLGACVLERHFTKDRTLPGPDQAASLEPIGLTKLVRDIRAIERALGSPEKRLSDVERTKRERLAKSVVTRNTIPAGTVITRSMLRVKSPGTGIPANRLEQIVGRRAATSVEADTLVPVEALEWERASL